MVSESVLLFSARFASAAMLGQWQRPTKTASDGRLETEGAHDEDLFRLGIGGTPNKRNAARTKQNKNHYCESRTEETSL